MQQPLITVDQQLSEKRRQLKTMPCNEQAFVRMESLFYDILSLGRLQKDSDIKQVLQAGLEKVKGEEFRLTQQPYAKARQRELAICKFRNALIKVLASYLKVISSNGNIAVVHCI